MANSKELFNELVGRITLSESADEVRSVVYALLEHQLGLTRSEVLAEKTVDNVPADRLAEMIARINAQEPLQYIIGEAYFYGRKFLVDPSVLIPRPETELIIDEILTAYPSAQKVQERKILDIGTGSGCIAITIALELTKVKVYATDNSPGALMTAVENARRNSVDIEFILHNILGDSLPLQGIDAVVSNPPYIALSERSAMKRNVKDFEPVEALFVPDENPLVFYSAISRVAKKVLRQGGNLIVEINEQFGRQVSEIFSNDGFHSMRVAKDMDGKDRIVSAIA